MPQGCASPARVLELVGRVLVGRVGPGQRRTVVLRVGHHQAASGAAHDVQVPGPGSRRAEVHRRVGFVLTDGRCVERSEPDAPTGRARNTHSRHAATGSAMIMAATFLPCSIAALIVRSSG